MGFSVNIPSCTSIAQNSGFMVRGVGIGHWVLGIGYWALGMGHGAWGIKG
ncbi:MAG: hypothetical protein RM049_16875 [Nostoc sp. DedQUE04]|nr:hypothetical protein [Nostoc sp. DedQUE04]MDZ8136955.1 hypothetical protein [Nostoc sp. DedQUE04]